MITKWTSKTCFYWCKWKETPWLYVELFLIYLWVGTLVQRPAIIHFLVSNFQRQFQRLSTHLTSFSSVAPMSSSNPFSTTSINTGIHGIMLRAPFQTIFRAATSYRWREFAASALAHASRFSASVDRLSSDVTWSNCYIVNQLKSWLTKASSRPRRLRFADDWMNDDDVQMFSLGIICSISAS